MTCEVEFYFAHNFFNFTSYAFNDLRFTVFWFIVEGLTPKTAEVMNKTKSFPHILNYHYVAHLEIV
jgi:hypothetical protein